MSENQDTSLLQELPQAIEADLKLSLEVLDEQNLLEMTSYHLGWEEAGTNVRGKRIRPLLVLLSCGTLGGDWQAALPTASAIELIHNFSLVHDDIEDNSETRRGRATIWKLWGVAKAINLGDAIFVLSRMSTYRSIDSGLNPEMVLKIAQELDHACLELTIGQQMDLDFEERSAVDLETYLRMIRGKTAALVSAATKCGAMIAGVSEDVVECFAAYGKHLGLAFQIRDDILGIWGESKRTGKSTGDDLRSRKKTLPILYGISQSQAFQELWSTTKNEDSDLQEMRRILDATHAQEYSTEKAEAHTQSALRALASIESKNHFHRELTNLTHQLLRREQ